MLNVKEQYKCQLASEQASFVDSLCVVFSQGYLLKAIEDISIKSVDELKVTEVGCYNARLMNFLLQRKVFVEYIGIDIREKYLNSSELKNHNKVTLLCEDITDKLSISSNSQDVVTCSEVLEHLDKEDLTKTIKNLTAILKKGGFLITSFPINTIQQEFHIISNERDLGHAHIPVHEEYINLVEMYGMKLVHFDSGFTIRSTYIIPPDIFESTEYQKVLKMYGQRIALAYAMIVDEQHTGGGYYTFIKEV